MLTCKPVAVQFMEGNVIAMFELHLSGDNLEVVDEKHYRLVPHEEVSDEDLKQMAKKK